MRGVKGSSPQCSVEGCERRSYAKAFCRRHYDGWQRTGDPTHEPRVYLNRDGACSVGDCGKPIKALGFCQLHYYRARRFGDPLREPVYAGPTHGLIGTYITYKCRCEACKEANRLRQLRRRKERALLVAADRTVVAHGSESTYSNWGCRCDECKAAHSKEMRSPRHRETAARSRAKASA